MFLLILFFLLKLIAFQYIFALGFSYNRYHYLYSMIMIMDEWMIKRESNIIRIQRQRSKILVRKIWCPISSNNQVNENKNLFNNVSLQFLIIMYIYCLNWIGFFFHFTTSHIAFVVIYYRTIEYHLGFFSDFYLLPFVVGNLARSSNNQIFLFSIHIIIKLQHHYHQQRQGYVFGDKSCAMFIDFYSIFFG